MTLAITVYFQWSQSIITKNANEDEQWRSVITGLGGAQSQSEFSTERGRGGGATALGPAQGATIATGLMPFFRSDRYRKQAVGVFVFLTQGISDQLLFRSLYEAAYAQPVNWADSQDVVSLNRRAFRGERGARIWLGTLRQEEERARAEAAQIKEGNSPPELVPTMRSAADERINQITLQERLADDELGQRWGIIRFLSDQVGDLLRQPRHPGPRSPAGFTDIGLLEGNLNGSDFTGVDIARASFIRVSVDGAVLNPEHWEGSEWYGTKWWRASRIGADFLRFLIENAAPYRQHGEYYLPEGKNGPPISHDEYVHSITDLCDKANIKCDVEHLPFGSVQSTTGE
jgi:hypothetical protein